jgi:hypothetical protein
MGDRGSDSDARVPALIATSNTLGRKAIRGLVKGLVAHGVVLHGIDETTILCLRLCQTTSD